MVKAENAKVVLEIRGGRDDHLMAIGGGDLLETHERFCRSGAECSDAPGVDRKVRAPSGLKIGHEGRNDR